MTRSPSDPRGPRLTVSGAPHPFTLRQLQYVVAVDDLRSFRAAAKACAVSQPSLSAQIQLVEHALGVQLFERDQRHVAPTAAGAAVVERARALLLAAADLKAVADACADPDGGGVDVGVIPTVAPYLLPEVQAALAKRFPRLTVLWREDKTQALKFALADGAVDAVVVALDGDFADAPHAVIGADPFVFAATADHPLVQKKQKLKLDDLDGCDVLVLDDGHCFGDAALAVCRRVGAKDAGFRATSLSTLVQMTAAKVGVTLLPRLAIDVENRHRALEVRAFAAKEPSRTLALVWRASSARAPLLKRLGATLAEVYALRFGDL